MGTRAPSNRATGPPVCPLQQQSHPQEWIKNGRQRFLCAWCGRTFGPTFGTPLYRLHTPPAEIARTLLIVMRRGSLSAAEEMSGHKYETIGEWLRRAGDHAEALTQALVQDLALATVEVDAFWSFVKKSAPLLGTAHTRRPQWAKPATPQTTPAPKSTPKSAAKSAPKSAAKSTPEVSSEEKREGVSTESAPKSTPLGGRAGDA